MAERQSKSPQQVNNGAKASPQIKARKRSRKPKKPAPQLHFHSPLPGSPHVAVIGGGLSGLVCAQELAARGIRSTVFDTGEHGPGGRLATRTSSDKSAKKIVAYEAGKDADAGWPPARQRSSKPSLVFDHAAQFFTVSHPEFATRVEAWREEGAVQVWRPRDLRGFSADDVSPLYIATGGMRSLATHLERTCCSMTAPDGGPLVHVQRPLWVASMRGNESKSQWSLEGRGRGAGQFDFVVIAHNGKCANRLAVPAGTPQLAKQLTSLKLSSIWALMAQLQVPCDALPDAAFVSDSDVLSWACNNTLKLQNRRVDEEGYSCWTLFSTPEYGAKNKVPQENVSPAKAQKVCREMLAAFQRQFELPEPPQPRYFMAQLWGAALPLNSPRVASIVDPWARVGVCGDWLLGASLQDATLSGIDLADRIAKLREVPLSHLDGHAHGLDCPFEDLSEHSSIGDFPRIDPKITTDAISSCNNLIAANAAGG